MRVSHISMAFNDAVLVTITTDEGIVGVGESSPLTKYTKSTPGSVYSVIKENLAPSLMGLDPTEVELCLKIMKETLVKDTFLEAIAAVEVALMDISAKSLNVPVYRLIGGKYSEKVPQIGWIGLDKPDAMAMDAQKVINQGFKTLKIKLAGNEDDVERVKRIKEVSGSLDVRADANESYLKPSLLKKLDRLELSLIEQPGPRDDLQFFSDAAKFMDTPLMLDESAATPTDILRIIELRAADIVKLKLMRQGGLLMSKKCAHLLEAADIPCVVGHGFNLLTGALSELHLAASLPNLLGACEIGGPFDKMTDDVVDGDLMIDNGDMAVGNSKGLGVSINHHKLEQHTTDSCEIKI